MKNIYISLLITIFLILIASCSDNEVSLGIEVVLSKPQDYFSHRKKSVSGMAYFEIAKKTLPAIELGCPIWLIGIG